MAKRGGPRSRGGPPPGAGGGIRPLRARAAAGRRGVHGGTKYAQPVRIDAPVMAGLEKLVPLAPLHQPHNLAVIRALMELAPELPQVACFDTAFHRTMSETAARFAPPRGSSG